MSWYGKYDDEETDDEKIMKKVKKIIKKSKEKEFDDITMTSSYISDDE